MVNGDEGNEDNGDEQLLDDLWNEILIFDIEFWFMKLTDKSIYLDLRIVLGETSLVIFIWEFFYKIFVQTIFRIGEYIYSLIFNL